MFLTGPKFRNLPASKLASDFRPFDPDILSCSGLFYNLSYTHVVHIYQHLYLIFSTFYRTLFTPEAYSATSSSVSFSAFFSFPRQKTHHSTQKDPQQADPFSRGKSRGVVGDRHPVPPAYHPAAQKRRIDFLRHDLSPVHFDLQMTVVRDRCDQIAVLLHLSILPLIWFPFVAFRSGVNVDRYREASSSTVVSLT